MRILSIYKSIINAFKSELHLVGASCWEFPIRKLLQLDSDQKIRLSVMMFLHLCIVLLFIFLLTLLITLPAFADGEDEAAISVIPGKGYIGTEVIVNIVNYKPGTGVIVCAGTETNVVGSVITDTDGDAVLSFTVEPQPAGWYQIWADDETNKTWTMFTVVPKIEINEVTGYVGDEVVIKGRGFAADKEINIFYDDTVVETSKTDSAGTLAETMLIIPESSRGNHTIKVEDFKGNFYEATFSIRQEINVSPDSGVVGSEVLVSGNGFPALGDVVIFFDDQDVTGAPCNEKGSFAARFNVPNAGSGVHKVKADDGNNRYYADFSVGAVMQCKPTIGNIGEKVTLSGTGFKANTTVSITYDGQEIETSTTNEKGDLFYVFEVPKSDHGKHIIMVSDPSISMEVEFTMESTPPKAPVLILPKSASREQEYSHFDWSSVNDPSGVSYVFELAIDSDFSRLLISQPNLTSSEYFLSEEESQLIVSSETPYFWRVQAVDGASNSSPWSEANSFFKGYTIASIIKNMPSWFMYALISLILIVFCVFFFYLGRLRNRDYEEEEDEAVYYNDSEMYSDSI